MRAAAGATVAAARTESPPEHSIHSNRLIFHRTLGSGCIVRYSLMVIDIVLSLCISIHTVYIVVLVFCEGEVVGENTFPAEQYTKQTFVIVIRTEQNSEHTTAPPTTPPIPASTSSKTIVSQSQLKTLWLHIIFLCTTTTAQATLILLMLGFFKKNLC